VVILLLFFHQTLNQCVLLKCLHVSWEFDPELMLFEQVKCFNYTCMLQTSRLFITNVISIMLFYFSNLCLFFIFYFFPSQWWIIENNARHLGESTLRPPKIIIRKTKNLHLVFFLCMWTSHLGLILFISSILH
jgi:hypothetical protein